MSSEPVHVRIARKRAAHFGREIFNLRGKITTMNEKTRRAKIRLRRLEYERDLELAELGLK